MKTPADRMQLGRRAKMKGKPMMNSTAGPVKGPAQTRDTPTTPHPIGPLPPLPPRRVVAVGWSRIVDGERVRTWGVTPW